MKEEYRPQTIREGLDPLSDFMQHLASNIGLTLYEYHEKNMAFLLVAFEFSGEAGGIDRPADFVSNCKREDSIQILRDLADRLETSNFIPPTPMTEH